MALAEKVAYYRRTRFSEEMPRTLQQMLSEALDQLAHVKDRLEAIDSKATEFRVISSKRAIGNCLCGRLTTFERGGMSMMIEDDPDATDLPLAALPPPPPGENGKQQQYATGLLHFCAFENHMVVVQSPSLRVRALEQHLAWLLRDKLGIMNASQGIALSDEPQQATRQHIRTSHVKRMLLGRPLLSESVLVPAEAPKGKATTKFRGSGAMMDLVKEIVDDSDFERLNLEDSVFDGNLEVWIEIRYPKRSRKRPEDAVRLLDDLALALRDFDEDQTTLELADGTLINGGELKVKGTVSASTENGLIDEGELYSDMAAWLRSLIEHGAVSN